MSKKPENARKSAPTQILTLPIGEIRPYEKNPRKNENAVKYVKESIRQFGFKIPIVIDSNRVIVCGHTRLLAAKSLGLTEVPCIIADDLTDDQINAFRLADNKVSEFAEWDLDLLGDELNAIADASDIDMGDFGFDLSDDDEETEVVEDEVPDKVDAICNKGEIWKLGEHRLMCGDSTDAEQVAKLMNGEKADLWLTDPPYNVEIVGGSHAISAEKRKQMGKLTIKNDKMKSEEFGSFLSKAFSSANNVLKEGASFYIWYADIETYNFVSALKSVGLQLRQVLIWLKNSLVFGRKDYHFKHEPCLYGWKDGKSHNFYGDRKQTTILEFDKPAKSEEHPTMKPIGLFAYQIKNSSKVGDIVLDSFGGSGTSLIACEQTKRICRMMELDPHYCDVIIARWEKLTGKKAAKVEE